MTAFSNIWVSEPDVRGTWGLIQTCLVTLFLCIYTAIHLNIKPHQSENQSWFRRIGASLLASAAPEFMFVYAVSQWNLAKQLQVRLNHIKQEVFDCEHCRENGIIEPSKPGHEKHQTPRTASCTAIECGKRDSKVNGKAHDGAFESSGSLSALEKGYNPTLCQESRIRSNLSFAKLFPRTSPKPLPMHPKNTPEYSLGQAFFIVSGGLAIETKSFHSEPFLTVTPTGAIELARLGLLEPVAQGVIEDKSKADPIAKVMVCVQAGWFIIQCIARVAQKLPLTLLEVHVLAHVLLALVMYLFWFAKPYNVLSPLIIKDPQIVDMAALFTLHQRSGYIDGEDWSARCVLRDELDVASIEKALYASMSNDKRPKGQRSWSTCIGKLWPVFSEEKKDTGNLQNMVDRAPQNLPSTYSNEVDATRTASKSSDAHLQTQREALDNPKSCNHHMIEESKAKSTAQKKLLVSKTVPHSRNESKKEHPLVQVSIDQPQSVKPANHNTSMSVSENRARNTISRAKTAYQHLRSKKLHFHYSASVNHGIHHRSTYLLPLLVDFVKDLGWDIVNTKSQTQGNKSGANFLYWLLPSERLSTWVFVLFLAYGALHLSAWNAHFPTTIERWLWRGAGLSIVGTPVFLSICSIFVLYHWLAFGTTHKPKREVITIALLVANIMMLALPAVVVVAILPIAAGGGRLYFLVEAFVSLREPVPQIYQTVEWTQFLPHV